MYTLGVKDEFIECRAWLARFIYLEPRPLGVDDHGTRFPRPPAGSREAREARPWTIGQLAVYLGAGRVHTCAVTATGRVSRRLNVLRFRGDAFDRRDRS